jgi:methylated-DNA-[protein]-cysteine S-methyltransferase
MITLQAVRVMPSPIGKLAIGCTDSGLAQLEILVSPTKRTEFSHSVHASQICTLAESQLTEYFAGSRKEFELPMDIQGTTFQNAVWQVIARTGFGEAIGYGEIARQIANPAAARAVGGAVGANPIPIVIGCHRVLGSGRSITGYSGGEGIKTKLWLLKHEAIEHRP